MRLHFICEIWMPNLYFHSMRPLGAKPEITLEQEVVPDINENGRAGDRYDCCFFG